MYIIISEKYRSLIESQYGSIIEFKRELLRCAPYATSMHIDDILQVLEAVCEEMIKQLLPAVNLITDAMVEIVNKTRPVIVSLAEELDKLCERYEEAVDIPSKHYRDISYVKVYDPYRNNLCHSNKKTHRCRNNC